MHVLIVLWVFMSIVYFRVQKPEKESWGTGLDAMQSALAMEKTVNQCLLDLHKVAEVNGDAHVCWFMFLVNRDLFLKNVCNLLV